MGKSVMILLAASVVVQLAGCSTVRPGKALRVATGLTSHTLCSATFVSGLDPDRVYAKSIRLMPGVGLLEWALRYEVDTARRQVTASLLGAFESRAVYRDGFGCLVVHGPESPGGAPPEKTPSGRRLPAHLVQEFAGPAVVEPANVKLRAALDRAFDEPDRQPRRVTQALVVVHDGRVVAERYAPGLGMGTPMLGWSMTKSVVNALVGILARQGRLSVDEPAPVAGWQGTDDPRRTITIDHLLRMTSGLDLDETGSGFDPVSQMLFVERDMAGFAEHAGLATPPGSKWVYSSGNALILSRIIRDAVGGDAADVIEFARRNLFDPLGMGNVTLEFDATGTPVGSTYMFATARDWARFGLLYLNDGVVNGERILPEGWVRYSSSPTLESGYGAGFRTNRGRGGEAERRVLAGMPRDSFFASGALGQRLVIVPSKRLVIVRLGMTPDWSRFDEDDLGPLIADVIAALGE